MGMLQWQERTLLVLAFPIISVRFLQSCFSLKSFFSLDLINLMPQLMFNCCWHYRNFIVPRNCFRSRFSRVIIALFTTPHLGALTHHRNSLTPDNLHSSARLTHATARHARRSIQNSIVKGKVEWIDELEACWSYSLECRMSWRKKEQMLRWSFRKFRLERVF